MGPAAEPRTCPRLGQPWSAESRANSPQKEHCASYVVVHAGARVAGRLVREGEVVEGGDGALDLRGPSRPLGELRWHVEVRGAENAGSGPTQCPRRWRRALHRPHHPCYQPPMVGLPAAPR